MSKKIILACMAIAAFAAFVIPATASAASPRLCETSGGVCTNIATGKKILATGSNTKFKIESGGEVTCNEAKLEGTLNANPANGEAIEGTITTADFSGGGTSGDCIGSGVLGSFKVTTTVGNGTPYCVSAKPGVAMELQIRGGACSEAARGLTFVLDSTSLGLECKYERTAANPVKGTYNTDESGQQATGTIAPSSNSTFVREAGSSSFCPEKGELEMSFTLETAESPFEALYIQ